MRAVQELHAARGVLRFTVLFGAMVLAPAFLLSYFALASIRAEELNLDAEIERRAVSAADAIVRDVRTTFARFEDATRTRLERDESLFQDHGALSRFLRVAFEVDGSGALVAPMILPDSSDPPEPSPRYRRLRASARRAEIGGRWSEAAGVWHDAVRAAPDASRAGTAELARALALDRAGRRTDAQRAFTEVYANYAGVRDELGYPLGDLAKLAQSRATLADPDAAVVSLKDFVDDLLAPDTRWVIGQGGEYALVSAALDEIDGRVEPGWAAAARARLEERSRQMLWAERRADELALLAGERFAPTTPPGEFVWLEPMDTRADQASLWAAMTWRDRQFLFAFDHAALVKDIEERITEVDRADEEIHVALYGPGSPAPSGALQTEPLPRLTQWKVVAGPEDPAQLALVKARQRAFRIAVIAVAVGMTALGVFLAARMLAFELDAARNKVDFAANVSHELRSPITQIRLKGEALQLDLVRDEADRIAHYDAIVRESERLSRLVDNILDFSAIERGAKKYTFRPEDLGELIYTCVESLRSDTEARGLDITCSISEDIPAVFLDREAISQVLQNLLSNAAKYGRDGGWIGVEAVVEGSNVAISVSDRGLGIKQADQELIWTRFFRSDDPAVRRRRGTGIGLTIVRYIVEEHGGTIGVQSAPGSGTRFTFTLPLEPRESHGG